MARSRNVRPEFFTDERSSALTLGGQLTCIGCWQQCDIQGVFQASARQIKSLVFPTKPQVTVAKVEEWIQEIAASGMMVLYHVNGTRYGLFRHFTKHQALSTKEKKGGNKFPLPSNDTTKVDVEGLTQVMPGSDPVHARVVPGSSLHRTEDTLHRTEDAGAPEPTPLFDPKQVETKAAAPADRWPYVQRLPWCQRLIAQGCKPTANNWPHWERLILAHGEPAVLSAAESVPADVRWPDKVETKLAKQNGQEPISDVIARKTVKVVL